MVAYPPSSTAARFDAGGDAIGEDRGRPAAERRPPSRQTGEVNEVEPGAIAESVKVGSGRRGGDVFLQRDQRVEPEHGVIEIARAGAILKAAVRVQTRSQEGADQTARLTQLLGRQPGDLQHLESQTHCTSP